MSNNSYIFNINTDAPDTGSIINFYSQFLDNSGENEYNMSNDIFFKTVFEYEKKCLNFDENKKKELAGKITTLSLSTAPALDFIFYGRITTPGLILFKKH